MGRNVINLIGQKFSRLTVIGRAEDAVGVKTKGIYWSCICDCGNKKIAAGDALRRGKTKSCGCLNNESRVRGGKTRAINMIGLKFGRLLVLEKTIKLGARGRGYYYECLCDCGNKTIVAGNYLRSGRTKSCGCYGREQRRNSIFKDLTGQKFGRLSVIGLDQGSYWKCLCDCGKFTLVDGRCLRSGGTQSCGCLRIEIISREIGQASFTNLFLRYKETAIKRGFSFEITKQEFLKITSSNCYYCNAPPILENKRPEFVNGLYKYNGIDRIDNLEGYVTDNVVPCCKNCNKAKFTTNQSDFLSWIKKIYNYQQLIGANL